MTFADTNIFIYAHDNSDPEKSEKARKLLLDLLSQKQLVISDQVVQEFCNAALKKAKIPLKIQDVRKIVRELLSPLVGHNIDPGFCLRVLDMFDRYSLSFYDASIVQAANDLDCQVLYSEDLQDGATYGKVKIVNPFR